MKDTFGESYYAIQDEKGLLKSWDHAVYMRKGDHFKIYINPENKGDLVERCEKYMEAENFAVTLAEGDDEFLKVCWRDRKNYERNLRKGIEKQIWEECERRYDGFSTKPVVIRIPYFRTLSIPKVRKEIKELLLKRSRPWPDYLCNWYTTNIKFVTESAVTGSRRSGFCLARRFCW